MYKVSNIEHADYGKVVVIEADDNGDLKEPFYAWQRALTQQRLWREQGAKRVRFLIADQVMNAQEVEHWSHEEYKNLPKCGECGKILGGDVHTHQLCGSDVFCSQSCADENYHQAIERLKDEEEIDYL
jgi:hypothetical protein